MLRTAQFGRRRSCLLPACPLRVEESSTMSITMKCSGCRAKLRLRDDLAGRKVKCPRCAKVLLVPEPEVEVAVAAEEEEEERITEAAPRRKAPSRIQREKPVSRGKRTMRQP